MVTYTVVSNDEMLAVDNAFLQESIRKNDKRINYITARELREQPKLITLHNIGDSTKPRKYKANYPGNPVGVRLPPVLLGEVDRIAKEVGINRAETIRKGIEVFVKYCNEHPGLLNLIKKDPRAGAIK